MRAAQPKHNYLINGPGNSNQRMAVAGMSYLTRCCYTQIMKRIAFVAWGIAALALVAGLSTLLFSPPGSDDYSARSFHIILFLSVTVGVLQPGAAALFLWGFAGFKRQLRLAYGAICVALVLLGLAQVQAAFLTYFELSSSFWVTSGLVVVPYIVPVLLMFYGVRLFAKLFDVKTIWLSFWTVFGIATVVGGGVAVAASILTPNNTEFLLSVALAAWTTVWMFGSVMVTYKTYPVVGPVYRSALRWFGAANATVVFAGVGYVASSLLLGNENALLDYGAAVFPHMIAGLLYIRAAYAFKLINQERAPAVNAQQVSLVDIIVFEASLASSPAQIDSILDTVRVITATGMQTLSPEQQVQLRQVYATIEQFLVEKEPVRQFTAKAVRQQIARHFGMSADELARIIG